MTVRIITDTMCDVPEAYVKQYNIRVMPLTVHFGNESYKDGIDITKEEFYAKLEVSENLPTTSQVSPVEFLDVFKEELDKGNEIVCINGSSKMSGTYNSAVLAKNQLESEKIHIIDSEGITLGAGMLAIKAARLAEQGMDAEAIRNEITSSVKSMKYFYIVDTLKYLHKGGRISLSANVLGSILNIKPILTINDGKLVLIEKARGIKKALTVMFNIIKDNGWSLEGKVVGINHTIAPENFKLLEEYLVSEYNVKEIIRGEVGSVVATHAGPGAVAIYFEV
ncbi:MAG: DegV family protein [Lutisporaceae bacterium]